jgi:hypothetical protein
MGYEIDYLPVGDSESKQTGDAKVRDTGRWLDAIINRLLPFHYIEELAV